MIDWLINVDTNAFLFLNGMHTSFLDEFMMLATHRFAWVPFYVALAAMLVVDKGWRRALLLLALVAVLIALTDQMCSAVLRPIFHRLRPAHPDNPLAPLVTIVNGYRGGHYGFPSSHAGNSFALAAMLSLCLRRRWLAPLLYAWAILHSYTRIYLGVHYTGDILVGALIGTALGFLMWWVYLRVAPRVPARECSVRFSPVWIPASVFLAEILAFTIASL